ncbi:MAG TPA: hypothetical protein VMT03_03440 [Polyangia bacterium]|nr:hypothetical protein [Polyangia bacterium]
MPVDCLCDPATGIIHCPDGGADCPPLAQDAGYLSCGCGSDTAPQPVCIGGAWQCPSSAGPPEICGSCSYLNLAWRQQGCTCDPTTGALTCPHGG